MTSREFDILSNDLRSLAVNIPLHWGAVQNDLTDDRIDMFAIDSYSELERQISRLPEEKKDYLRRRWYLWKCSQCDEYLFYVNDNVEPNPNPCDKTYDVRINGNLDFDIKGTVIPQSMRGDIEGVLRDPRKMIDFFYDEQSTGRRYDIQNRLFIVHHSFVNQSRELYLRCAWRSKRSIYREFCQKARSITFYKTHGVISGVIFILEREKNKVQYRIFGL